MDAGIDPGEKVKTELQVEILAPRHQIGCSEVRLIVSCRRGCVKSEPIGEQRSRRRPGSRLRIESRASCNADECWPHRIRIDRPVPKYRGQT